VFKFEAFSDPMQKDSSLKNMVIIPCF